VDQLRVLGIAGSLRRASYNRGLVRAAVELAPTGIVVEAFELEAIPLYSQDVDDAGEPAPVVAFKSAIARADALLVATPGIQPRHSGRSEERDRLGVPPARDQPPARQVGSGDGASPGRGSTARAQAQLRDAFVFTGACVMPLPELLVGGAVSQFDGDGNVTDPALRASLVELIEALGLWTKRIDVRRVA
jgi:chromate reductase